MKLKTLFHSVAFVHLNTHSRSCLGFRSGMMQLRNPRQGKYAYSSLMMLSTSALEDGQSAASSLAVKKFCVSSSGNPAFGPMEEEIASKYSIPTIPEGETSESAYTHCVHILPYEYNLVKSYAVGIQPLETSSADQRRANRKKKNTKSTQMQPTFIDFCPPLNSNLGKRVGGQRQGGEMLLKAVAPAKYSNERGGAIVYDLTAGFGQDSMILAAGHTGQVHMMERDPIVALLLKDAMRRLHLIAEEIDENRCHSLNEKLFLHESDAVNFCKKRRVDLNYNIGDDCAEAPDVCYLDPMFPPRTKSAAVKKNMQILHGLFHTNEELDNDNERWQQEQELLNAALALAKSRVVVKRPVNAPPLGTSTDVPYDMSVPLPSFELKGSINRFDIYMKSS